jgi:MFS family permease
VKRWAFPALAFLTGTAVTVMEFAAPSLFRAHFGQTVFVWANVIGVILGALALGYALGGRWADRTTSLRPLASALAFAGLYGLLVGWLGPALSRWISGPQEYTQDTALHAFFLESLAASLLLFGPPLVALGMASPLMVQRATAHFPVGKATGLIFSVGTIGSITGIYLTTFALVPVMGVRATITVSAGVLLGLGAAGFLIGGDRRRAAAVAGGLVLVPLGLAAPWDDLPPEGGELVVAIESPYQLVRVVDRPPDGEGRRARWLVFDEGMGTYHSVQAQPPDYLTGAYYDVLIRVPEWVGSEPGRAFRICIVGNAAGTMDQLLRHHNPDVTFEIDAVEIDPAVTRVARETMGLTGDVYHVDGRTFLRGRPKSHYDAILMDAYARQVSIPAGLATREFFALCKSRLRPGGMVFVNLGALRAGGLLVNTLCDTMAAGFSGDVYRAPLNQQQNVLLVAARDSAMRMPPEATPLLVPVSFGKHVPGDNVLTDDYCPVEFLTAKDLLLVE